VDAGLTGLVHYYISVVARQTLGNCQIIMLPASIKISHLEIGLKSSIFRLYYYLHSSSADCVRDLFKPSKDSA